MVKQMMRGVCCMKEGVMREELCLPSAMLRGSVCQYNERSLQ